MLKIPRILVALTVAALATPALAGSWPNLAGSKGKLFAGATANGDAPTSLQQYRVFPSEEYRGNKAFARDAAPGRDRTPTRDGFEYVGGDTGWQLSQHKYVLAGGRFEHSNECDHAIRMARAPSPAEVDAARRLSPGN